MYIVYDHSRVKRGALVRIQGVCMLLLLLLLGRNKQSVTATLTSRTPTGSRDPFLPFPGKLGSLFYNRDSNKKNYKDIYLVEEI